MPMQAALELHPQAVRIATDMKRYREASSALAVCLRRVVEALEPVGYGAAYLDAHHRQGSPEALAERLARTVREELRLPLRVGVGPSKFLAKLAAEEAGDAGVFRVRRAEVEDFLSPLPISRLPRVGQKTEQRLAALGATTIGDVLALDRQRLEAKLGNHGLAILEMASGQDRSPIRVARHPASLSREHTLDDPAAATSGALGEPLRQLAMQLESALERQGLRARRVALKLRFDDQSTATRSTTLGERVLSAADIYSAATELLGRLEAAHGGVRAVGLTLAGLAAAGQEEQQLDLFRTGD
jgi:DNA polymerase-4